MINWHFDKEGNGFIKGFQFVRMTNSECAYELYTHRQNFFFLCRVIFPPEMETYYYARSCFLK